MGVVAESAVTAVLSEAEFASLGTTTAVFSVVVAFSGLLLHEASRARAATGAAQRAEAFVQEEYIVEGSFG